jgi:outer membrane protein assembly factor BamA
MTKVEVYDHKRMTGLFVILFVFPGMALAQYRLQVRAVDKDTVFVQQQLKLQTSFRNAGLCKEYVAQLPSLLQSKGYPAASVDSVQYDSLSASMVLYVGELFRWLHINTDSVDKRLLNAVAWNKKQFEQQPLHFQQLQSMQQKMLNYLENNGYPFASVTLDSITLQQDEMYATLKVVPGPLYKIDSIRNYGTANISSNFLQHYLSIPNGSIYRKERLQAVSKKLSELPYVQEKQPWNLTLLGTGSILNLYADTKRSSLINVLVGFLPANDQLADNKLLITGEATVNLKNSLGGGETIGLNWQQIQVKSPRLNILFQQPYLFNTSFGINFNFDLFKKDSSFVNIGGLLGVQYALSSNQTGSVFIQNLRTNLLTVDTNSIKNSHRLPQEADVSSVNIGINYEYYNTDYRFNPRRGNELLISAAAGTKTIKKNNLIVKLKDGSDPTFDFNSLYDTFKLKSYQFRIKAAAAHYFRLTRASTFKLAGNAGLFQSPSVFRNELFQIGGYKLLRGFDEESIFASQYAVGTAEYRYLLGQNSFLFAFVDMGWAKNTVASGNYSNTFLGAGLGMAFETKAGIFNISYAAGKRDDTKFNLRQSKIHLGYVNYF